MGSNWPYKNSPWWQALKKAVKHTGLYWNFLGKFCFKENENTLNILEYTGEKWDAGILLNILENILEFIGRRPVATLVKYWPPWSLTSLILSPWPLESQIFDSMVTYQSNIWVHGHIRVKYCSPWSLKSQILFSIVTYKSNIGLNCQLWVKCQIPAKSTIGPLPKISTREN